MQKLIDIKKDYKVADTLVHALKGVSINFRSNELVSILGPSGCGKTTMLNLIGGLDHATSGDLVVNGKSTKEYKDRDWDVYRNHRIGFIFQSYNLIPHQTVLGNVELALTIAGISKEERVTRARAALDKVGLSDKYDKKPNQLSGGQCQRVAIARALVNDPEILLADEPTGALDTKTSKQIMDLVKEIAGERLVIMVTHNPELAEEYSTRIIRLLDGNLLSDTNPYSDEEIENDTQKALNKQAEEDAGIIASTGKAPKKERAKMSFLTAFKLSVRNLFTKKKRTVMTSIAGSIGIIGVSMVLAISFGIQGFLDNMQGDMLASNPIEISQTAFDINALGATQQRQTFLTGNWINVNNAVEQLNEQFSNMQNIRVTNNIDRNYIAFLNDMPEDYWSALFFDYGLDVSYSIFTDFGGRDTSLAAIRSIYGSILEQVRGFEDVAPWMSSLASPLRQAPDMRVPATEEYLLSQYTVLYSREGHSGIARERNEVMLILGRDRTIDDIMLGQLGFYSQEEFVNIVYKAIGDETNFDAELFDNGRIDLADIMGHNLVWQPNDNIFDRQAGNNEIPFVYNPFADSAWTDGLPLTIVGILEPNDEFGMLESGFYYTTALAEYMIYRNYESTLNAFIRGLGDGTVLSGAVTIAPNGMVVVAGGAVITFEYEYMSGHMIMPNTVTGFVGGGGNPLGMFGMIPGGGGGALDGLIMTNVDMQSFGGSTLPNRVAIYSSTITQVDNVTAWLDRWNDEYITITLSDGTVLTPEARERIVYTDTLSFIMGMMSALIDIITIALIAFTSLALIVSCVMIAIITYISVVERIKEIGVIRSLGGRKRDVSNLFVAETFIIGFVSGLIGVIVTYIMVLTANLFMTIIGVGAIASFPWYIALLMLGVSVGLTLASGLVPSQSAAKKDPVVALRSE